MVIFLTYLSVVVESHPIAPATKFVMPQICRAIRPHRIPRHAMTANPSNCQRRLRIVEGRLQGQLLRQVCWHWSLFLLLSFTLTVSLGFLAADPNVTFTHRLLDVVSANILPFLVLLTLLPYFLVNTVRLSNRFAGPVRRLRRALEELAFRDQTHPLVFRDNDFWVSTANAYNAAAERHQQLLDKVQALEAELERERQRQPHLV